MDFTFVEKLLISYLEKHPDVVEKLIESLINRLIAHFNTP